MNDFSYMYFFNFFGTKCNKSLYFKALIALFKYWEKNMNVIDNKSKELMLNTV